MRSHSSRNESSLIKTIMCMLASSVLTLFLFALIVNFAPLKIANIFLNPIGVAKGLQYMQEQEEQKAAKISEKNFKKALSSRRGDIFNKESAPFIGNPNAKVEIVIFSDYKCGYCRLLHTETTKILNDPKYKDNVKFILMEYPIMSKFSVTMAIAALEVFEKYPAKFEAFNNALYEKQDINSELDIIKIARGMGMSINFKDAKRLSKIIENNLELGGQIGVRGTPAIIIGEEFIPGFIGESQIKSKIDPLL